MVAKNDLVITLSKYTNKEKEKKKEKQTRKETKKNQFLKEIFINHLECILLFGLF